MAGIGFKLVGMARSGGLIGLARATGYGVMISSGPWLCTIFGTLVLQNWAAQRLPLGDDHLVQTVLVYAFTLSGLAAAPFSLLAVRLVADCLYLEDHNGVPALLLTAMAAGTSLAFFSASIVFGIISSIDVLSACLATLLVVSFAQIWLLSSLLTAVEQYRIVLFAYGLGALVTAGALSPTLSGILLALDSGTGATLGCLALVFRRQFSAPLRISSPRFPNFRTMFLMILAGVTSTSAIWIDKILIWFSANESISSGGLLINPVNDQSSFIGLLGLIPGMTLIVLVSETRFDSAFQRLLRSCTGSARYGEIENQRASLFGLIIAELRLLVMLHSLVCFILWVFALPIFDFLGANTIGIFAFRRTVIGTLFHLIILLMCVFLAYFDLFGCILLVWSAFLMTSGITSMVALHSGAASYGSGYMYGAIVGATVAVTLVLNATRNLPYLLFVGNNPSIVGSTSHRIWV